MKHFIGLGLTGFIAILLAISITSKDSPVEASVQDYDKAMKIMFSINMNLTKRIEEIEKKLKITPPSGSYKLVTDPKDATK